MSRESELQWYFCELRKIPLLTSEQEKKLGERIQKHQDPVAREQLIRANLRLVVSVAKRFVRTGLLLTDLIAEGNLGLMHAVDLYNPRHEARFSTYATWWIRQSMQKFASANSRPVRIPTYMSQRVSQLRETSRTFQERFGHAPDQGEMADQMHTSAHRLAAIERASRVFPTATIGASDEKLKLSVEEMILDGRSPAPSHDIETRETMAKLRFLLDTLDEREAMVVRLHHGLGRARALKLHEIAEILGVTRERVRQIEMGALRKLESLLNAAGEDLDVGSGRVRGAICRAVTA